MRWVMGLLTVTMFLLGSAELSRATSAINVDLHRGVTDPENAGTPSAAYGAASGQVGTWNEVDVLDLLLQELVDTDGNPSGAAISLSANTGGRIQDNPTTSGDDEALLDDGYNLGNGVDRFAIFTITGLVADTYRIFTYGWDPSSPSSRSVTIDVNATGPQLVAPASNDFTGFVLGETHAMHVITIGAGEDVVIRVQNAVDVFDSSSSNGFQIVPGAPDPVEPRSWGRIKSLYY